MLALTFDILPFLSPLRLAVIIIIFGINHILS